MSFLTREYAKRDERVIKDDGKFTHSLDLSLRCKLFAHIYVEITKFDLNSYPNSRWRRGLMIGQLNRRT